MIPSNYIQPTCEMPKTSREFDSIPGLEVVWVPAVGKDDIEQDKQYGYDQQEYVEEQPVEVEQETRGAPEMNHQPSLTADQLMSGLDGLDMMMGGGGDEMSAQPAEPAKKSKKQFLAELQVMKEFVGSEVASDDQLEAQCKEFESAVAAMQGDLDMAEAEVGLCLQMVEAEYTKVKEELENRSEAEKPQLRPEVQQLVDQHQQLLEQYGDLVNGIVAFEQNTMRHVQGVTELNQSVQQLSQTAGELAQVMEETNNRRRTLVLKKANTEAIDFSSLQAQIAAADAMKNQEMASPEDIAELRNLLIERKQEYEQLQEEKLQMELSMSELRHDLLSEVKERTRCEKMWNEFVAERLQE
eukprot:TRINITY_DN2239_c0_g1_i1.p1 TRINITY_DN2239_c0_g1~~TRINITY_DN2239_c0_g1_i1.p1  ORF type:complete len:355 (-),score=140.89 TRINITY_DN2239_c0_g1_i1:52-1116(-)